jgi:hypothetical protein
MRLRLLVDPFRACLFDHHQHRGLVCVVVADTNKAQQASS